MVIDKKDRVMKFIPVFKPYIEKPEIDAATEALKMGWLGMGSYVDEFEKQISSICELDEDSFAVSVSTGHAALHLSLLILGVGKGDEVITPSFNNSADFQAIVATGASPVFVDVNENDLCLNIESVKKAITKNTKCIISMDYDLFLCNHDELRRLGKEKGIAILHDAAHSFGSRYKGVPIGKQHQLTIFSFDPVKTVTCIDGGAIIVKGKKTVERLHAMRLLGMTQPSSQMYKNSRAWSYDIKDIGYRYHLANLHAAIGIAQLAKLNKIRTSRQRVCSLYMEHLKENDCIIVPKTTLKDINPFLFYIRITDGKREKFRAHMHENGVDTGIHWQAGHHFTFFKKFAREPLPITDKITQEIVSIPLHSNMPENHISKVIEVVNSFSG